MKKPKIDVVVDLQFGSTGKGALSGYLSYENDYVAAISVNMPNAGHTAYAKNGQKFIHKVLPSGIFSKNLQYVCLGPGSVFSVERLKEEVRAMDKFFTDNAVLPPIVIVHELAGILKPEHAERERSELNGISSTMQGSAAALMDKIMRKPDAVFKSLLGEKRDMTIAGIGGTTFDKIGKCEIISVSNELWLSLLKTCNNILLEGSQGYSLGLNAGFYPYCTSRDCTPARVMSDAGVPMSWHHKTYGSARTYPIRVGNTDGGFSGDWYPDQEETSFESLGVEPEKTTVTGRIRRIATFSKIQMKEAMTMAHPDHVFLNFCNYATGEGLKQITNEIDEIAREIGCGSVSLMGWGPMANDVRRIWSSVGACDSTIAATIERSKRDINIMAEESFEWASDVFPKRSPMDACIKLFEETSELADAINTGEGSIGEEIADCLILLLDIGEMYEIDFIHEFYEKMRTNRSVRKWRVINGAIRRMKDGE